MSPQVRLAWVRDFPAVERVMTGCLLGAPEYPFTVYGTEAQSAGFEASLALQGQFGSGIGSDVSWNLEYRGLFRHDMSSHSVAGRVEFRF